MKIKNKILIGLLSCLGCLTLLCTKTYAFTPNIENEAIYSNNLLNLNNYIRKDENIKLLDISANNVVNQTAFMLEFPCGDNTNTGQFFCEFWNNNQLVRTFLYGESLDSQSVTLLEFNEGQNIPGLLALYPNAFVRFKRNGNNVDYSIDYSFTDMMNYALNYVRPNDYTQNNGLRFTCVINQFNNGTNRSTIVEGLAIHFATDDENINHYWYEEPGVYYTRYAPQTIINQESYQKGIEQNKSNVATLETENATLRKQVQQLQESLGSNTSWKSLAFAMADTPFKTLSTALDFEILDLNIWKLLVALITLLSIIWLIKKVI